MKMRVHSLFYLEPPRIILFTHIIPFGELIMMTDLRNCCKKNIWNLNQQNML